jgi:hypothetical protein
MKFFATVTIALSFLLPSHAQSRQPRRVTTPQPAPTNATLNQLPLKRVILYSNGVAYFERRGTITGRAEINLSFKQSQVDDVLKSLVVLDLGQGRVNTVSYNSSAPPSARLNEIPLAVEAATDSNTLGGMAGVLQQMQGAKIALTTNTRTATGAILTIQERKTQAATDKVPVTVYAVVIATDAGEMQSFDLAEVRSIKLLDEGTKHDLREFTTISAAARRRDAKTITITSEGTSEREMIVSYTIAAPVWKTTYRVVLDAKGEPFFQGWAIVDNVSEEDWKDVQLSLVSGTPLSFIQPLQHPLYRHRPINPIPADLQLDPQIVRADDWRLGAGEGGGQGVGRGGNIGGGDMVIGGGPGGSGSGGVFRGTGPTTSVSDAITSEEAGIETAASGNEIGDLFEYRIAQPVTVERDRSALIPILQTKMQGARVSVFRAGEHENRPRGGVLLKNTSALTFESGALTVLDGDAYAGEAMMERLKPGEEQFIPFAVDLGTLITTRAPDTNQKTDRKNVFLVRAINGVFQAHYYRTEKKTYTLKNQTARPRIVYIEHPRRAGWLLSADTLPPSEKTEDFYRFRIELAPHASQELPVTENQALMDSYQISTLTPREIDLFTVQNYIDPAIRTELEKLLTLKSSIATTEAQLARLNQERQEISEDQKRLRDNIEKLKSTAEAKQLIARYIAKADTQETRLEQIAQEKRATEKELGRLQSELAQAVKTFSFTRELRQ